MVRVYPVECLPGPTDGLALVEVVSQVTAWGLDDEGRARVVELDDELADALGVEVVVEGGIASTDVGLLDEGDRSLVEVDLSMDGRAVLPSQQLSLLHALHFHLLGLPQVLLLGDLLLDLVHLFLLFLQLS